MDTVKKFRCCLYSLLKKFRALNFRGLGQQRNFFNNENFPIYGIFYSLLFLLFYILYISIIIIDKDFIISLNNSRVLMVWGNIMQ